MRSIYKYFDRDRNMWALRGYCVSRYYKTESEADADINNVWKVQLSNINGQKLEFPHLHQIIMNIRRILNACLSCFNTLLLGR